MRFHTAVNKFCWQAVMGQPITVWNTAYDQKRPYLDLFDASRAIAFIIENNIFDGRIYNVLTQNFTVRQVVDSNISERGSTILYISYIATGNDNAVEKFHPLQIFQKLIFLVKISKFSKIFKTMKISSREALLLYELSEREPG